MAVKMAVKTGTFSLLPVVLFAVVARLFLVNSPASTWLKNRVEFSTPQSDWKRLKEGLSLSLLGISPYSGDIVHETPLVLALFHGVQQLSENLFPFIFVVADVFVGLLLHKVAYLHVQDLLKEQKKNMETYGSNVEAILVRSTALLEIPNFVSAVYLLNPYSIGSCVAHSTGVFTDLGIVLALYAVLRGKVFLTTLGIAIATYQSLYPVMLLIPVVFILRKRCLYMKQSRNTSVIVLHVLLSFVLWLAALFWMSYALFKSWDFLQATYGFILLVPDLTPNVGLFWYFFTEMFEHFRTFFLWVFQINAFFYCIPLAIRLKDHPTFMACSLCCVMAVMKSYPTFGDASLPFALLALWTHVFPYMRNTFLVACMFVFSTFLTPVFWHLWIYAGSANANFFFAITLVYSSAQILLASDVVFAFLRREYDLLHGIYPPVINGHVSSVVLR